MKRLINYVVAGMMLLLMSPAIYALTVTYTQPSADPGEIMKGKTFVVTASGWSGSCTVATINLDECSGCVLSGEDQQKAISGQSSVSWTTVIANQKLDTPQKISVSVSGGCSLQQAYTSEFYVVLPPSLDVSISPSSVTVDEESDFVINSNIRNKGETTARNVQISVSNGATLKSGCSSISSMAEDENVAQSCTLTAGSPGIYALKFTITSSNADSVTKTITLNVKSSEEENSGTSTGGGGGGGSALGMGSSYQTNQTKRIENKTKKFKIFPPGLVNNTKLLKAIEKVLEKGKLSEQAKQNLINLAAMVKSDLDTQREFVSSKDTSKIRTKIKYKGKKRMKNFMLYESLPKQFASNASEVHINAPGASRVEVVESDPSWLFTYDVVEPGDELVVEYDISGTKGSSTLDMMRSEVYVEHLEEIKEETQPTTKKPSETLCKEEGLMRCSGNELMKCKNGRWEMVEKCEYGCENNKCKEAPPQKEEKSNSWLYGILIVILLFIVVVTIVVYRKYISHRRFHRH